VQQLEFACVSGLFPDACQKRRVSGVGPVLKHQVHVVGWVDLVPELLQAFVHVAGSDLLCKQLHIDSHVCRTVSTTVPRVQLDLKALVHCCATSLLGEKTNDKNKI
jgi:hypothetical protein